MMINQKFNINAAKTTIPQQNIKYKQQICWLYKCHNLYYNNGRLKLLGHYKGSAKMEHAIRLFDPVDYIQGARRHGFTQEQSEFNAQQLERIIEQQNQAIEKKSIENENRFEKNLLVKNLATKSDLQEVRSELKTQIQIVKSDLQEVRSELKAEIQVVRSELKAEIQDVRSELKTEIQNTKSEIKEDTKAILVKMEQYRYETIKFIVWTGIAATITLVATVGGIIAKGSHWW